MFYSTALLSSQSFLLSAIAIVVLSHWLVRTLRPWVTRPKGGPYAPGPKPKPIIGNMLDLPTTSVPEVFQEWSKKYNSDILFASALGKHVLVLNKEADADELFERRSQIYSDREPVPMLDLMEWQHFAPLFPYGDKWRQIRKLFQQHFRQSIIPDYYPIIQQKVDTFLRQLLSDPAGFPHHCQMYSISLPMSIMYGYEAKSTEEPAIVAAEKSIHLGITVLLPGATLANVFPILRHLPSFLPGTGFKKIAAEVRHYTRKMKQIPLDFVAQQLTGGIPNTSVIGTFMKLKQSGQQFSPLEESSYLSFGSTVYGGATETTTSFLISMFYHLALNPRIQQKARSELELVTGGYRLPTFEDRKDLPYIEAIYRELNRLQPPGPVGLPHTTTEDDYYKGYFIPKGTSVIGNIWAMSRDESKYENPLRFYPERYFKENGELNDDDQLISFGFGRRVCPGKHMASATLWIAIASILAVYEIRKERDSHGREIEIAPDFYDFGLTRQKSDFRCSITPHSDKARKLVEVLL